ncbi:hypothetical protein [Acidithiobacillus albertensis]|uniref:hypothetical protein n=1 Tax=Acidithiobacillus albertensis TaxID=119978 RepID=UPI00094B1DC2|nr:hypothetical protein [Acidithiobacillus albertensis]
MTCDFYVVGYSFSQVLSEAKLLVAAGLKLFDAEGVGLPLWIQGSKNNIELPVGRASSSIMTCCLLCNIADLALYPSQNEVGMSVIIGHDHISLRRWVADIGGEVWTHSI